MDNSKTVKDLMHKYFETVFYRPRSHEWSNEELERLCAGIELYGQDFAQISKYVVTKTAQDVSH